MGHIIGSYVVVTDFDRPGATTKYNGRIGVVTRATFGRKDYYYVDFWDGNEPLPFLEDELEFLRGTGDRKDYYHVDLWDGNEPLPILEDELEFLREGD